MTMTPCNEICHPLASALPGNADKASSKQTVQQGVENSGNSGNSVFSASLRLRIVEMQSQTFSALAGAQRTSGGSGMDGLLSSLAPTHTGGLAPLAGDASGTLSASGRNMSLFDPESAYRMMTTIANKDVLYKAQVAELSDMRLELAEMQTEGSELAEMSEITDASGVREAISGFIAEYNEWSQRFDADMQAGGLLADTQAAQVSRYELKHSIENRFFGVTGGVRGLGDLGISIDPVTKLASLDGNKLETMLANNRQGVVDTLQEFGENFAKSAALLTANGNFIANRLDNLNRVISFIKDNRSALQSEFGTGDPARPQGQAANALAAYQRNYQRNFGV